MTPCPAVGSPLVVLLGCCRSISKMVLLHLLFVCSVSMIMFRLEFFDVGGGEVEIGRCGCSLMPVVALRCVAAGRIIVVNLFFRIGAALLVSVGSL